MTRAYCLGLDVGTSSVKGLAVEPGGGRSVFRAAYKPGEPVPLGWENALVQCVQNACAEMGGSPEEIALCAQVGTYLLQFEGQEPVVVHWASGGGAKALEHVLSSAGDSWFLEQISMRHPRLESYPLVRLAQLQTEGCYDFCHCKEILAPKDHLYRVLTGERWSDPYTWRGLASMERRGFSRELLSRFKLDAAWFPPLAMPWEAPGKLCRAAAERCGVPEGIPVYLGCNDFFAGLLGMGSGGQAAFDLTGTSEHVGVLCGSDAPSQLISGPYFNGYVKYGVTASSGSSMAWAFRQFGKGQPGAAAFPDQLAAQTRLAPVFLPYLNGERAPIWDSDARGVFFGLESGHGEEALFYSVLEGVAFSAYQIWELLGDDRAAVSEVRVGGGAAADVLLNRIKAALFQLPIVPARERECGALGAAMLAMYGSGKYNSLKEAQAALYEPGTPVLPEKKLQSPLLERYSIYRELYPALKEPFAHWAQLGHGA